MFKRKSNIFSFISQNLRVWYIYPIILLITLSLSCCCKKSASPGEVIYEQKTTDGYISVTASAIKNFYNWRIIIEGSDSAVNTNAQIEVINEYYMNIYSEDLKTAWLEKESENEVVWHYKGYSFWSGEEHGSFSSYPGDLIYDAFEATMDDWMLKKPFWERSYDFFGDSDTSPTSDNEEYNSPSPDTNGGSSGGNTTTPSSGLETVDGYIRGPGTGQEFGVFANKDFLELKFSWNGTLDPYCKVLGRDHNHLGTFRLTDGEIIELTGGGQFYIIVGTYSGSGNWTCNYNN